MIVVGIDVASQKHDYFMLQAETGTVFSTSSVTIPNNEAGYKKLHKDIQTFCGAMGDSNVRIGLESTGIYSTNIIAFLVAQEYKVMMINPILTNMTRKAHKVHSPKNDNLDSQTICKYLVDNQDRFSPYTTTLYHKQALKSLSRKRFFIVNDLRKAKLSVNNLVQLIFPEFKGLFSNIYGESALSVLKEYNSPAKLAKAHVRKVASLLHGRCKCTAEQLIEAAKHTVGLKADCYAFELADAIEELEHIQRRVDSYDAQIKKYVDELCPNLLSIPGVGYTTAGLIAGEIGDIDRFHSADSLVSFSGTYVTVYESGKYKAQHCMPSKKGSRYLRYALFQIARIIWQHDPVFNAYYIKKQNEGKHYYVILGHVQKKVIRVVYSLMKSGASYEVRNS
ncbi:MAG: IS110 family transposase [Candidatus Avispirillum sp.]